MKQIEAITYPECSIKLKNELKQNPSITVDIWEKRTNKIPIENHKYLWDSSFFLNIKTKKNVTIRLSKRVIISLSWYINSYFKVI